MPARYCGHRSGDCAISSRVVLSSAAAEVGLPARQQAGRREREQPHLEQALGQKAGPASGAEADGGVEALVDQVYQLGRGLDLDIDVGPHRLERGQTRQQPQAGEGLQHREPQRRPAPARPDGVALALDEVDRLADAREIARPGRRQLEAAVEAAEQRRAQLALEFADAPAHRRGREVHGLRRFGEAQRTAGRHEDRDGAQRGQAGRIGGDGNVHPASRASRAIVPSETTRNRLN